MSGRQTSVGVGPGPVDVALSARDQALVDVGRAALRAHQAGVYVAVDYKSGQWTIGGDT